jgi:hypothetical protein
MPTPSAGAGRAPSRGRVSTKGGSAPCPCPQCTGIEWRDVVKIAPDILTGMTEAEAKKAMRAERPMLVYVYPMGDEDDETDYRFAIEKDHVFADPRVRLACKFFDFLRIDRESAAYDRKLKKYASRFRKPALVLVRPNFEAVDVVSSRFSANDLYKAMARTIAKDYRNDIDATFKKERAMRVEWDEVWREQGKLDRIEKRLTDLDDKTKQAELEKERDALKESVEAQREKLLERERKLYELDPKKPS